MEAYTDFANVYDIFMDHTPYKEWAELLLQLMKKYGVSGRDKARTEESQMESQQAPARESQMESQQAPAGESPMESQQAPARESQIESQQAPAGESPMESQQAPVGESQMESQQVPARESQMESQQAPARESQMESQQAPVGESQMESQQAPAKESQIESQQAPAGESHLEAERRIVVDLGCGTGILTELLADAGYDMIGVDSSQDMLNVAMDRREASGKNILYLNQDIRELELYGTAGAMVSVCDCLNYLLEEEELLQVFRLVNNYLYPGGIFLFDFNTVYKYEKVIGDTTIAENREDCSFIWENFYDKESCINEYDLTVFVRCQEEEYAEAGLFRQFVETHFQRGYTLEQIKRLVEQAGMEFITALDGDTHKEPREESQRILVVARESGKSR